MDKQLKDYLKYYIGCDWQVVQQAGEFTSGVYGTDSFNSLLLREHSLGNVVVKPILRKLESMSEDEMKGLLISMTPPDMEDAPDAEDYSLVMFYNDGGNDVDGDVAVGANCACICWEGQLAVRYNGDIDLFDEEGNRDRVVNQVAAFHYLLSRGFDLFGLIDAGLAIDKVTIKS